MSRSTADNVPLVSLRERAQERLATGTAPQTRGSGLGVETLALLHRLATTPESAPDALKLLHELQVHQVELDLNQAQIEANEHELTEELARYRSLYEHAPVAHFVLDAGGRIVESNRAGAELLGSAGSDPSGRRFDEFISFDSRLSLAALLREVRGGAERGYRRAVLECVSVESRPWRLVAGVSPDSEATQLVVTDGPGSREG